MGFAFYHYKQFALGVQRALMLAREEARLWGLAGARGIQLLAV